jgi:hypothetical protein
MSENSVGKFIQEANGYMARNNADTRKRKWWLYAKLDALMKWAKESSVREVNDFALDEFVAGPDELKATKLTFRVRVFDRADYDRREEVKRVARAQLMRCQWASTLAKSGIHDPASAIVREHVDPRTGDVMLAIWNGPKDEAVTEPSW